ncbi:carbohydrate ABC transporter permease [Amycolatopsis jiangsuensis]|uniref:Cellobiose transport system permease protein n=1 Tax=Amycolatopsis jiangsuensis TaxID=1181879 RepID=A0A840IZZ3_9PSEU|nr:sugar ABC transporter permease [Amycolatopsis jiangsuensis]MBB4688431.1 cellobiose transport system permease protein [Amycolatopsis jiangsuensis]
MGKRGSFVARLDRKATPFLFIAPFFAVFAVFGVFPLLYTTWVSLHDWDLLAGNRGGFGFANYVELFGDPRFYNALVNTVGIFLLAAVPEFFLALGFAELLNRKLRGSTWWQTGVLVPNVVSVVAVGVVFTQLYGRDFGVVNEVLGWFGVPPVNWQAGRWSSHLAVASMVMWRWTGYNALIYLAAMQAVPQDLYEAAELDGASRWRTFWSVTVPGIRPAIAFTAVAGTVNGLQLFAEPQLFDAGGGGTGGNDRQFQTLAMYLYEKGFTKFDAGYAAALSWVVFLVCVVFAVVNYRLVRRFVSSP